MRTYEKLVLRGLSLIIKILYWLAIKERLYEEYGSKDFYLMEISNFRDDVKRALERNV